MNDINDACVYCATDLHFSDKVWVDSTDGDCCWGDDDGNNENEPHVPAEYGTCDFCDTPYELASIEDHDPETGNHYECEYGDDGVLVREERIIERMALND